MKQLILFISFLILQTNSFCQLQCISKNDTSFTLQLTFPPQSKLLSDNNEILKLDGSIFIEKPQVPTFPHWNYRFYSSDIPQITTIQLLDSLVFEDIDLPVTSYYLKGNQKINVPKSTESPIAFINKSATVKENTLWELSVCPYSYNSEKKKLTIYTSVVVYGSYEYQPSPVCSNYLTELYNNKADTQNETFLKSSEKSKSPVLFILSPEKYCSSLAPFIDWKRQKGIEVELLCFNENIDVEDVKNIISKQYLNTNIDFAILVGNENDIPPTNVFSTSDIAYGFIEGDDYYPEVIVGRFAVDTEEQLASIIRKTIDYERGNMLQSSSEYNETGVFVASEEGPGDNNEYDYEHLNTIALKLSDFGLSSNSKLFASDGAGQSIIIDSSDVIESINTESALFYYTGHGTEHELSTSGFDVEDVALLNNSQLPVGVFSGCRIGAFENTNCLAEELVKASSGQANGTGMVALVASTEDQWWSPPMLGQDVFTDIIIGDGFHKETILGAVLAQCFFEMNTVYGKRGYETTANWSIFGDPSLQINTLSPKQMNIICENSISIGSSEFSINIENTKSQATLWQNGVVLFSDSLQVGEHIIQIDTIGSKYDITLTVTAPDYKPFQKTIVVVPAEGAFISLKELSLLTRGNDGYHIPLDTVWLDMVFENYGTINLESLTYSISAKNAETVVLEDQMQYSENSFSPTKYPFIVIPNGLKNGDVIDYAITVDGLGLHQTFTKSFDITAPSLQIKDIGYLPTHFSSPSDLPAAGEIRTLSFSIYNTSPVVLHTAAVDLYSKDEHIFVEKSVFGIELQPFSDTTLTSAIWINSDIDFIQEHFINVDFSSVNGTISDSVFVNGKNSILTIEDENEIYANVSNGWSVDLDSYSGENSLSCSETENGSTSLFEFEVDLPFADSAGFWYKTSCETGYYVGNIHSLTDYLSFKVDGKEVGKWGGENDWTRVSFPVDAGKHTLSWEYIKDGFLSEGRDAVWIDDIFINQEKLNTVYFMDEHYNLEQDNAISITSEIDSVFVLNNSSVKIVDDRIRIESADVGCNDFIVAYKVDKEPYVQNIEYCFNEPTAINHQHDFAIYKAENGTIKIHALAQSKALICDILGRIVLETNVGKGENTINTNGFEKGVYFLQLNKLSYIIYIE